MRQPKASGSMVWTLARWIIAVATAVIVAVGIAVAAHPGPTGYGFSSAFITVIAIVPAGVLALRVRTPRYIAASGAVLLGVTVGGWGLFFLLRDSTAFAGVYVIPPFLISVVATGWAATLDERKAR